AAAEAMHRAFDGIAADGSIVIGEGRQGAVERLWVGERIGEAGGGAEIDVALDALEGATVCATGGSNALSIILIAERGHVLACPETYMEKVATGPEGRGMVSLDKSPTENLRALAEAKSVYVEDLTAVILDRPRHDRLVEEVRRAGARVQLLADGDLAAAIATARPGTEVDILLGIGGAQQGVLAAGAIEAMGGFMEVRFRPRTADEGALLRAAGISDPERVRQASDLVGDNVMFAATGVTGGHLLSGVRFFRGGARTNSVVMRSRTRTVRWIEAHHHFDFKPEY
ncbi:MAG: fructose-bisphosphatase class II family protein, partial [Alphaproteobacteria bacterium]